MSYYIPLFHLYVITYPCFKLDAGPGLCATKTTKGKLQPTSVSEQFVTIQDTPRVFSMRGDLKHYEHFTNKYERQLSPIVPDGFSKINVTVSVSC